MRSRTVTVSRTVCGIDARTETICGGSGADLGMKIVCYSCEQKLDVSELAAFTKVECPVCESKLIVPKPFGNLLLEEDLGNGGITHVYRAMDMTLDREVALKVLREELAEDHELAQRFVNEARAASAINHPNVIPIYSCGEMEDQTYITMQYMEGGSLLDMIKRGDYDQYDAIRWICEASKGLDNAHVHGVLHQNISPGNILMDLDGNIKIGDFGLTLILDENKNLLNDSKVLESVSLNRSYYVSPEKISAGKQDGYRQKLAYRNPPDGIRV